MITDVALQVGVYIFLHGTAVLAVAWLIVRTATALPAASKHATWVSAFVVLLLLPLGYGWMPGWTLNLEVDSSTTQAADALPDVRGFPGTPSSGSLLGAPPGETDSSVGTAEGIGRDATTDTVSWSRLYRWGVRWLAPGFLLIWGGGVLLLLGRLGLGMRALWRWKQSAVELEASALSDRLAQQLSLRRSVSVRRSPEATVPVVWGLLSPVVILPKEASDWSRARLRSVLLHELAHVKRWDALTHLVGRVARACFWPNPLVWTATNAATAVQEQACDNSVLRSGVASWKYAEQLLAVTKTLREGAAPMDAVALDSGMRFKDRMRVLLKSTSSRRAMSYREMGLFAGASVLVFVTVSALQVRSSPDRDTQYWIEAERAILPAAFASEGDETASQGGYVTVDDQASNLGRPPRTEPIGYRFRTDRSGRHLIWARVRVQSDDHNSLWLRVDSTRWIRWNGIEPGEQWHWVQVRDADQDRRPVAFELAEGSHQLQIGPREEGIDVDQFVVTDDWHYRPRSAQAPGRRSGDPSQIWLEAEEGWLDASFEVENAPHASSWQHIVARPNENSRNAPPASGRATYSFTVDQAGTYQIWGRVVVPASGSDSFWLRMDGGSWIRWNDIREAERWHWDQVHDADEQNAPAQFDLAPGEHQLTLAYRERGVKIDRLLLTRPPTYRPRGTGKRVDDPSPFSRTLALEDAGLTPPMVRRTDSSSPDSSTWIGVPDAAGNDAPEGGPGAATWTLSVPESGEYVLWGEVRGAALNDNSFYVSVDGGQEIAWHVPDPEQQSDGWVWDPVSHLESGEHTDPFVFSLSAGRHRIRVRNREDGTHLRHLRLTNVSAQGPTFVQP